MRKLAVPFVCVLLSAGALHAVQATEATKVHEFLAQLAGEWESDSEVMGDPAQPAMKFKGTESGKTVGDSWVILEIKSDSPMGPMTGVLTVGYDGEKKKIVGTWIDSVTPHMWTYEGELSADGKTLTLNSEGPNPMMPGKTAKFRDKIEFKDKNNRVFTSSMQGDNGDWTTFVTVKAKRKG